MNLRVTMQVTFPWSPGKFYLQGLIYSELGAVS